MFRGLVGLPVQLGLGALSLATLGALLGYGFDGWFARYTSDDYCTADRTLARCRRPGGNSVASYLVGRLLALVVSVGRGGVPPLRWGGPLWAASLLALAAGPFLTVRSHFTAAAFRVRLHRRDPGAYPNPCVAQFYGLPSIRSVE